MIFDCHMERVPNAGVAARIHILRQRILAVSEPSLIFRGKLDPHAGNSLFQLFLITGKRLLNFRCAGERNNRCLIVRDVRGMRITESTNACAAIFSSASTPRCDSLVSTIIASVSGRSVSRSKRLIGCCTLFSKMRTSAGASDVTKCRSLSIAVKSVFTRLVSTRMTSASSGDAGCWVGD